MRIINALLGICTFRLKNNVTVLLSFLMLLTSGCNWFDGNGSPPEYTVGGTVTGLTGQLTLQNNAADDLVITADGTFTFATPLTAADDYAVTVGTQPNGQSCNVTNAAGSIGAADVTNVEVSCVDLFAGLFVDDLVLGLDFTCSSGSSSETTADGQFTCPEDDDISFWLGSNELGPVPVAYTIISPLLLFPDDGLAAINLARLLQSLDSDLLPGNGEIVIDDALVAALPANLDFSLQAAEFEAAVGMTLVSLETAVQRLRDGIAQYVPQNTAPIADAGADRVVAVGATVTLSGAGSSDANGDGLTFNWTFVSTPAGSSARLASRFTVAPSFVADVAGSYVVGVLVSDGTVINYDVVVVTANDDTGLPAAPQGLQAVGGDSLVALTWGTVSGATSYKMYYNTNGNVGTSDAWTSGLSSTVINFGSLTNGTTYYYKVAAVNAIGEGSLSNEASAIPQAPAAGSPAMPQGVQAFAGDTLVSLNWTAVSGASSYTVYWNTTGGVLASDASIAAGSSTGLNHTGLVNGTNYYYRVAATNASGEGPLSATRLATPAAAPPVVTYSVGGAVTGFSAGTLTLQNNGADDLVITPAGAYFTFPTRLPDGSAYNVTVSVQPDGLTCTVTYLGSGTISGANVTNVGVTCVDNAPLTYSVGGTVSGLAGTVGLQNNGADTLAVTANGSFTFSTPIEDGGAYSVTVSAQPAGQTCSVTNGAGTVSGADVATVGVTCAYSPTTSNWKWANPLPHGHTVNDMAWDGNQWVAIGEQAALLTSNDGSSWTVHSPGFNAHLEGIAWNDKDRLFVAVGSYPLEASAWTPSAIVSSPDGTNWTRQNPNISGALFKDVIWTGSRFVAVGQGSARGISTSTDGVVWTRSTVLDYTGWDNLLSVAFNGSQVVAVGSSGNYSSSDDGLTWAVTPNTGYYATGIASDGSQFAAVGYGFIKTSADGVTWTEQDIGGFTGQIVDITWNGTQFVAVGGGNIAIPQDTVFTSYDGIAWNIQAVDLGGQPLNAIGANDSQLLAAGMNGAMLTSFDAVTWTSQTSTQTMHNINAVIWTDGQFVAAGSLGRSDSGSILTSRDGVTWTAQNIPDVGGIGALTWGNGQFVALGANVAADNQVILTSADGVTWDAQALDLRVDGSLSLLRSIAWGAGLYVALGGDTGIVTSEDAVTWTVLPLVDKSSLKDIIWTGSQFVAVGSSWGVGIGAGGVATSQDGINWTPQSSGVYRLNSIAWNGEQLVACGTTTASSRDGIIMTSFDGVTWTPQSTGLPAIKLWLNDVIWAGTQFVVIDDYGVVVLTSPNGETWESHPSPSTNLNSIGSDGSKIVVVGNNGRILTNDAL